MNSNSKLLSLISLVGKKISDKITVINLLRLSVGDLSHIGDALLEGKRIAYKSHGFSDTLSFASKASDYFIQEENNILEFKKR